MTEIAYEQLNNVEQQYWDKWMQLFLKVDPKHPEKGIVTMIKRARAYAEKEKISLEQSLSKFYKESEERTERRMYLLSLCSVKQPKKD